MSLARDSERFSKLMEDSPFAKLASDYLRLSRIVDNASPFNARTKSLSWYSNPDENSSPLMKLSRQLGELPREKLQAAVKSPKFQSSSTKIDEKQKFKTAVKGAKRKSG
jgi:hypothetical protein